MSSLMSRPKLIFTITTIGVLLGAILLSRSKHMPRRGEVTPPRNISQDQDQAIASTMGFVRTLAHVNHRMFDGGESSRNKAIDDSIGFVDVDGIASELITPRRSMFDQHQAETFRKKFERLLRARSIPDAATPFQRGHYEILGAYPRPDGADVQLHLTDSAGNLDAVIVFRWRLAQGRPRLINVALDKEWLVDSYGAYISRLIDRSGINQLFKELDLRIASADGR